MSYETIKSIAKKIIPRSLLIGQEERIRRLLFVFYSGDKHECPLCKKKFRTFARLNVGDDLCPYCGCSARHRRLWTLMEPMLKNGVKVLDFSPPRCLYRKMIEIQHITYTPTDLVGEFLASRSLDITRLDLEDASYDLITCYHVLEHVDEDRKAMQELFRVLRPGGTCFVQTPFKEGDIYEDPSITTPQARKQHFEQEDHVRIYSADGLMQRLMSAGFSVERLDFTEKEGNYHGFRTSETVLVARK